MPLIRGKSENSFKKNVKTEYNEGKPLKQSLAIAYAMKKKAQSKAKGGFVREEEESGYNKMPEDDDCYYCAKGSCMMHKAKGGYIEEEEASGYGEEPEEHEHMNEMADEEDEDMIHQIMREHYSRGGQVANADHGEDDDELAGFEPAEFDDLYLRDDDMEDADYTGRNSGDEIGDRQEDEDRDDILSRVMRSKSKKDRMPIAGYGTSYGKYK